MLYIHENAVHDVPLLIVEEDDQREKPALLFYHGLTSAKEHNLHMAYTFAKKGFRVILPDALHHGKRVEADCEETQYMEFWSVVEQSIKELPILIQALEKQGYLRKETFTIGGTSMGAITSYGAPSVYDWIVRACLFMGAPQHQEFAKYMFQMAEQRGMSMTKEKKQSVLKQVMRYDLSTQLPKLKDRYLYIWHGTDDDIVPFQFSKTFVYDLQQMNTMDKEQVTFYPEDGADHKITRKAMLDAASWLERQVSSKF